ncbi:MAG: hypothetical protein LBF74_01980 [Treponema sp.]|jgi:hypothetical protein|nr:hypothetical protein [Treponema sp.]
MKKALWVVLLFCGGLLVYAQDIAAPGNGGEPAPFKMNAVQDEPGQAAMALPDNFTTSQRWGTWALNQFVLGGLGSYVIMHDWVGGSIMLGLQVTGTIFMTRSFSYFMRFFFEDIWTLDENKLNADSRRMTTLFSLGFACWLANAIFNIVRSAAYDKPAPKLAKGFEPGRLNIAVLPGENGFTGETVQVSYTLRF